jgi:small nuclear ribonucleoprotein (snRNP)-like protein
MNINDMTIGEAREIVALFGNTPIAADRARWTHPLLGRRVLVRTYSAGVHIGTLVSVNPDNTMECHLKDALRLWKWTDGGLSLSAVAHNGIKGGRLNRTDEVTLTNAIEYIPTTPEAEATYVKFIED